MKGGKIVPEVFITLEEAAELEGVKYNTLCAAHETQPRRVHHEDPRKGRGRQRSGYDLRRFPLPEGAAGAQGGAEGGREGCHHRAENRSGPVVRRGRPERVHREQQKGSITRRSSSRSACRYSSTTTARTRPSLPTATRKGSASASRLSTATRKTSLPRRRGP